MNRYKLLTRNLIKIVSPKVNLSSSHFSNVYNDGQKKSKGDEQSTASAMSVPRTWTWRSNSPRKPGRETDIIVKMRIPLTVSEVVSSLEKNGAEDIKVISISEKSNLAEAMVFCTGKSMRHMQRISDSITYSLKRRKLTHAPGITGAEGYQCDDWMVIDCWNIIVHVFEEKYRKTLNLEEKWEKMETIENRDFQGTFDYESEDEEDEGLGEDDSLCSGEIFASAEEEKREAERIAKQWEEYISGATNAGGNTRK
mmetsp:Transcript_6361/g.9524  ORF Transcript_6361/g.9524 Transcript_6361/m.9524 type:complete len:254 (+) Transcript_6361:53-814(+)